MYKYHFHSLLIKNNNKKETNLFLIKLRQTKKEFYFWFHGYYRILLYLIDISTYIEQLYELQAKISSSESCDVLLELEKLSNSEISVNEDINESKKDLNGLLCLLSNPEEKIVVLCVKCLYVIVKANNCIEYLIYIL